VRESIGKGDYDCVINAAAYTDVDGAENNYELSRLINCESVKNISQCLANTQTLLIHYSTDYVFNGEGERPYKETDNPSPINLYGQSKYDGENVLMTSETNYLLLRTSWVYDDNGNNFPNKILEKIRTNQPISVVDDQIGVPNYAISIADMTYSCIQRYLSFSNDLKKSTVGVYHMSSLGEVSWYEFANYISDKYCINLPNNKVAKITPVKTNDFLSTARRPLFSVLDSTKLSETFDIELPSWQDGANQFINSKL
tara:strand:- start:470 stop:1234 length:765 start_codon:yes stop_codon:yes gene_type:complete